jgi:hypothetical protein
MQFSVVPCLQFSLDGWTMSPRRAVLPAVFVPLLALAFGALAGPPDEVLAALSVSDASVLVTGSAPVDLAATPGDRQVTLRWDEPAFEGGGGLRGYHVEFTVNGVAWERVGTLFPATPTAALISGLQNNWRYRFRVRGVWTDGDGAWSQVSAPVSPFGPVAPPSLSTGQASLAVNGVSAGVVPRILGTCTLELLTSGHPFTLRVWGEAPGGAHRPLSADDQALEIEPGSLLGFAGEGFKADTHVTVYLFHPVRFVGQVLVGDDGRVGGPVLLPDGVPAGPHILQLSGIDADGNPRTLDFGIRISPKDYLDLASGLPGAPTTVRGVGLHGSVQLGWSPPDETNGLPILRYAVEVWANSGPGAVWFELPPGAPASSRMNGLTNGVPYRFRVAAITAAGRGPFSPWSPTVIPGPPELRVEAELTSGEVEVGQTVTIRVSVTNVSGNLGERIWLARGLQDPSLRVEEVVSVEVGTIVTDTNGDRYWQIGDLEPGQRVTMTFRAVVLEEPFGEVGR